MGTHSDIAILFPPPEGWGPEWSGAGRVWMLDTRYASRALVRRRQLDGPNEVRFVHGYPGFTAEKILNRFPNYGSKGVTSPSLTRVRAPGCYAYQVDGRTFSYLVVFEAELRGGQLASKQVGSVPSGISALRPECDRGRRALSMATAEHRHALLAFRWL